MKGRFWLLPCTLSLLLLLLHAGAEAKQKRTATESKDPLQELIFGLRGIVNLGLGRGDSVEQVCADACGLLDNDTILYGKLARDYMPFCEKQCPAALESAETTGILESDDALKAFILKKFNRDEL